MEIRTFRAKSMPQALELVRQELGPEATVLHTREVNAGLLARMLGGHSYEIAATQDPPPSVGVSLRKTLPLAEREAYNSPPVPKTDWSLQRPVKPASPPHAESRTPHSPTNLSEFQSLVAQLRTYSPKPTQELPPTFTDLLADLVESEFDEPTARELIDRLRTEPTIDPRDMPATRAQLARMIEAELTTTGPIRAATGSGRVVALVGPTGVGKTTTIAKLAANYRLKEGRRVGLITVDTYRIAAVEQLRTYAEIIDLPMEVVSTPREMRAAVRSMRDFDLVLMDTAGRSPRDEVRIRELRAMLAEAEPHEVHLVLSAAASARSLTAAAEKFAPVGVTALAITKVDEATGLGHLVSLARSARLPFSYLTDGQTVPDDIEVAEPALLSRMILNLN